MHLLGPATGMERQLTVAEISENWTSVVATELTKQEELRFSGVGLGLPGATADFESSRSGDVIAFLTREHQQLNPIGISDSDPKPGEVVWLLSPNLVNDSLVHRAVCVSVMHDVFLVYEFDRRVAIPGTSGGPIVNEQGYVVGVHRGGGMQAGKTVGVATLASRFLPSLVQEIQSKSW